MISTTIGNTALIQWQPPKEMVGEHVGYQLQYKRAEEEAFTIKDFRKTDDHFTVTGLHKGASYVFKLCAKNRAGNGEEYVKEISTPEDIPSSYPQNLSVVGLTASSTKLAWDPPPLAERNGRIVKYVVVYRDINSQHNNTNGTTETQMAIQGLQPDTTYDIRVQAFTSKGGGPMSPSIQSRTMSTSMPGETTTCEQLLHCAHRPVQRVLSCFKSVNADVSTGVCCRKRTHTCACRTRKSLVFVVQTMKL